ncbi:hypothetical protein BGW80DRAFT_1294922 [Lactifluus volemus]|nr:hypothetical protein BGW80DRAFT_1294922 [Lactifluus volemus]
MSIYHFVGPRRQSSDPCQRAPRPPLLGSQPLGANTRAIPPSERPLHSPDSKIKEAGG